MTKKDQANTSIWRSRAARPFWIGAGFIVAFFGGLVAWSALAPLAGAVIATGNVAPEGATRVLQHLEGGIVDSVLVREGQTVRVGEPLVKLQTVQAQARYERLKSRDRALAIRKSRLLAELKELDYWTPTACCNEKLRHVLTAEKLLFDVRRRKYAKEADLFRSRETQLRQEIGGLREQNRELELQIELIDREIDNVNMLLDKGLARLPRLLSLKRGKHQLKERKARNTSQMVSMHQEIEDFDLRFLLTRSERLEEINQELLGVRRSRLELAEDMSSARDIMERTIIRAPVDGVIENIRVRTRGGVISPGGEVLDIVPENEQMLVEAKVRPTDIDDVRKGQTALVHLSPYSYRYSEPLHGAVETVSADLVENPQPMLPNAPQAHYAARIRIDGDALSALPADIKLTAGMPTEVFITAEPRTVLNYLIDPLRESVRRAFREP